MDYCGKDSSRKFCWNSDGKKYRIGNVFLFTVNQGLFFSADVDDVKMAGKKHRLRVIRL